VFEITDFTTASDWERSVSFALSLVRKQSIVMSMSVCVSCLCTCLSASISPELQVRSLPNFYASHPWPWLTPFGCVAIHSVLLVFVMTIMFAHNCQNGRNKKVVYSK